MSAAAYLLTLTLCILADGLMEILSPRGFVLASAVTVAAVILLQLIAERKEKGPISQPASKRI